jgi:hypothetical protein
MFSRLSRHSRLPLLALTLVLASCATLNVIREEREVRRTFRQDVANFFAAASESYFILSYEYHNLAQEFRAKGDTAQADIYDKKATLYYNLSKDLDQAAKVFLSESIRR